MIYHSDKAPPDYEEDDLLCPRCKNPVSVLPDLTNPSGEIYFCYGCMREVEDPIEDDTQADEERRTSLDWRPEFEMASAWGAWVVAVIAAILTLMLLGFCAPMSGS